MSAANQANCIPLFKHSLKIVKLSFKVIRSFRSIITSGQRNTSSSLLRFNSNVEVRYIHMNLIFIRPRLEMRSVLMLLF